MNGLSIAKNFKQFALTCLSILPFYLFSQGLELHSSSFSLQEQTPFTSQPVHEVASLGAPTTGALLEGVVGSMYKGCRHRFYCHSTGPKAGFLGPTATTKPLSLKDQPGVFPAPLMGAASLSFSFNCHSSQTALTPVVVRPDGTVLRGIPMTETSFPQTLVVSSPAQTGIYTLFVLAHQKEVSGSHVTVHAKINTQPQNDKTFPLKAFELKNEEAGLISAEFIYSPEHF